MLRCNLCGGFIRGDIKRKCPHCGSSKHIMYKEEYIKDVIEKADELWDKIERMQNDR